jgi:Tfp pilus assembly protein PilN
LSRIDAKAVLPYLLLLAIGVAVWQFAWLPGNVRRAQLLAEKTRLQTELAAQEQLLGQRTAVQEMESEWQAQAAELARRLPPLSYWPEMLAELEELFFRPGLTVTSFRVTAPLPLPAPAATGQDGTASPAPPGVPQQGDLLAASGEAAVTADSKEAFFSLLAALEALEFLTPVRSVSYTLSEGKVQGRLEFQLLPSFE